MYYQKSLKNLHLIEGHSGNKFYCMIREFHPRKIYSKHVWNEIQAGPQRDRPTKDLVSYSELDPIAGHRFFTTDPIEKHGPAVGIAIFAGHHRIYELYRRYLNDKLKNFKFEGEKNGNVKVIFEEAW